MNMTNYKKRKPARIEKYINMFLFMNLPTRTFKVNDTSSFRKQWMNYSEKMFNAIK